LPVRVNNRPSATGTGFEVTETVSDVRPLRDAVSVIIPGVSVERMNTRLIPHSVMITLLLEYCDGILKCFRYQAGPAYVPVSPLE
jgi:hypothetical protein